MTFQPGAMLYTQGFGARPESLEVPVISNREPTTSDNKYPVGKRWVDTSGQSEWTLTNLSVSAGIATATWSQGGNTMATTTEPGIVLLFETDTFVGADDTTVPTSLTVKTYVDATAIAGGAVSTETVAGIGQLATNAEAVAGTPSTGALALFVTPSNLTPVFAAPPAIGGTTPAAGTFTDLTADGNGTVSLGANAASDFTVTGAFDLSLESTLGSINLTAGQSAADSIAITSTAGGIDILATGAAAGEDIDIVATGSSVNINSTESAADSIVISSTNGGIDILATGAAAGEDIDITATGSSVNITSTENAADSIVISSTNGGIDITAAGAAAGEDIDITATGSSVNLTSTENAALAIYLHADGGASETIRLRADQGTGVDSIDLLSDVGGITLSGGVASADAINIVASDAAGGIDIDAGTAGIAADSTGAIVVTSTANSAASIYLHANGGVSETIRLHADQGTGVASININSDVGGVTLTSGLATADAININATDVGGGIDIDSGTAGIIADTTGAISLDAAAASNFTVTGAFALDVITTLGKLSLQSGQSAADSIEIKSLIGGIDILAAGAAAGEDIDIIATGSSVNIQATESDVNAITINASGVAGGINVDAGTSGVIVDTTGAISLDSAAASNFTVTGAFDLSLESSAGSVNVTAGEDAADAIVLTASAGGIDILATGAAAQDIDIVNTGGSVNITATESAADSVVITSTAGGIDILASGAAAGEDIDITATGSSVNITATENVSDAIVINASGAASGITIDCGTVGVTVGTGMNHAVTSVATAATPYAVLGTDYFITTDSTGGALEITLPAAPATGRTLVVYDGAGQAAAGGNVTINGNGKNIAAGGTSAATKLINTAYESYNLVYNGTLWCGQNVV